MKLVTFEFLRKSKWFLVFFTFITINQSKAMIVAYDVWGGLGSPLKITHLGSTAPDKFIWTYATGVYIVSCEVVNAPNNFTSFQGNCNTFEVNAPSTTSGGIRVFLNYMQEVQLGYDLRVNDPNFFPPQCSNYGIKFRIHDMRERLIVDWREIRIIRNDYLYKESNAISLLNVPDLFIQDRSYNSQQPQNKWDFGHEPFLDLNTPQYNYTWVTQSQDLWNRYYDDQNSTHQNPMPSRADPPLTNFMNYRIRNRGCALAENADLHLYWTIARLHEPWAHDWYNYSRGTHFQDNKIRYNNFDYPLGNEVCLNDISIRTSQEEVIHLSSLSGGGIVEGSYPWYVPEPDIYRLGSYIPGSGLFPIQFSAANSNPVICMLARIDETTKQNNGYYYNPSITSMTDIETYVNSNNNVATRNTYILNNAGGYAWRPVNGNPRSRGGEIIINPVPGSDPRPIHIGIKRDTSIYDTIGEHPDFLENGHINLYLDQLLWDKWVEGGMVSQNIEIVDVQVLKVTNPDFAALYGISLAENQYGWMAVEAEFYGNNTPEEDYLYSFGIGELDLDKQLLVGSPTIFNANVLHNPKIENTNEMDENIDFKILEKNEEEMKVFPNRAFENVYICLPNSTGKKIENVAVEIITLQGQVIKKQEFNNYVSPLKLGLENISSGTYILSVKTNKNQYFKKIYIE